MAQKSADQKKFKSGFVAIVGKPNVGKSTLINKFLNDKVSIVSSKPKTTRNKIQVILTTPEYQLVFLDTPGIHKSKYLLDKYMLKEAESSLDGADIIVVLLDATSGLKTEDRYILDLIAKNKRKIIAINKVDIVHKPEVLLILSEVSKSYPADDYIPLSALKEDNVSVLFEKIVSYLPQGEQYFPEDQMTDKPMRFHAAEMIREKILENTRQEVPYSIAVLVSDYKEVNKKNLIIIKADIYVERESQKGILIGKKGEMLKKVGTAARIELEKFLNRKVFLELNVKTYEKWRQDAQALKKLGYD